MVPIVDSEGERILVKDIFTKTTVARGKTGLEIFCANQADVDVLRPRIGHEVGAVNPDGNGKINGNSGDGGRIEPVKDVLMILTDVKLA